MTGQMNEQVMEDTAGPMSDRICHVDCCEYLPIDVFKGFCTRTGEKVIADDSSCDEYRPAMKCRLCGNYTPASSGESMGMCMDKVAAYPGMLAKTCEWFKWKDEPAERL